MAPTVKKIRKLNIGGNLFILVSLFLCYTCKHGKDLSKTVQRYLDFKPGTVIGIMGA